MMAMVFGNFSQGRLEGEAYGHVGIMKFKGIFHDGVMVSTNPPYGPWDCVRSSVDATAVR